MLAIHHHSLFTHPQFKRQVIIAVGCAVVNFVVFFAVTRITHFTPIAGTLIGSLFSASLIAIGGSMGSTRPSQKAIITHCLLLSLGLAIIQTYCVAGTHLFAFSALATQLLLVPLTACTYYVILQTANHARHYSVAQLLRNNWGLIILNLLLIISTLAFIKAVPFATSAISMSAAPDEAAHYNYNVKFMLDVHRLPVAGSDDTSAYTLCNINQYKQGICLYSYTVFPGANYVFSAMTAEIGHDIAGLSYVNAARLAGLFWAIIALNFLYLAAVRLVKKRPVAWLISSVMLLPQIIFIGSYTNQDIHSLAIGALVVYALVRLLQDKTAISVLIAGVAFGGLLPLAKYNYFILAPVAGGVLLYCLWHRVISTRLFAQTVLASSLLFVIISAFWYVRNLVLYHDLLGQQYVRELTQHIVPSDSILGMNFHSFQMLNDIRFFDYLFNSFFAAYGYMVYFFPDGIYTVIKLSLLVLAGTFVVIALRSRQYRGLLLGCFGIFLATLLLAVGLVYYNAVTFDPQAQGRYIFNVIAPLVGLLAFSYKLEKRMIVVIIGVAIVAAVSWVIGIGLFLQHYNIL